VVSFEWLEECLKAGERLPEHKFAINYEEEFKPKKATDTRDSDALQPAKRSKMLSVDLGNQQRTRGEDRKELAGAGRPDASTDVNEGSGVEKKPNQHAGSQSSSGDTGGSHDTFGIEV
jgi:DNA polymerase lambda